MSSSSAQPSTLGLLVHIPSCQDFSETYVARAHVVALFWHAGAVCIQLPHTTYKLHYNNDAEAKIAFKAFAEEINTGVSKRCAVRPVSGIAIEHNRA